MPLEHSQLSAIINVDNLELMQDIVMGVSVGFISLLIRSADSKSEKFEKRCRFSVTPLKEQPRQVNQFLLTLASDSPVSKKFILLNNAIRDANIAAAKERRLLQQLEQSYERVSEFSTMAAHDLKAPLRNIDGFLGILEEDHEDELSDDGIEVLRNARKSASKLQRLISDLLNHAQAKSSKVTLERISLGEAVDQVREDMLVTIKQCNGLIEIVGSAENIEADPLLFGQLLGNLIGNAIKYRSLDRALEVKISCSRRSDKRYEINIQDNGLGFDNADRQKVMIPFHRLHTSLGIEGSGLGLATCKSICDLHGWTLHCYGQPGVGATFTIGVK